MENERVVPHVDGAEKCAAASTEQTEKEEDVDFATKSGHEADGDTKRFHIQSISSDAKWNSVDVVLVVGEVHHRIQENAAEREVVEVAVVEEEVVPSECFVHEPFVTHEDEEACHVDPHGEIDEMTRKDGEIWIENGEHAMIAGRSAFLVTLAIVRTKLKI